MDDSEQPSLLSDIPTSSLITNEEITDILLLHRDKTLLEFEKWASPSILLPSAEPDQIKQQQIKILNFKIISTYTIENRFLNESTSEVLIYFLTNKMSKVILQDQKLSEQIINSIFNTHENLTFEQEFFSPPNSTDIERLLSKFRVSECYIQLCTLIIDRFPKFLIFLSSEIESINSKLENCSNLNNESKGVKIDLYTQEVGFASPNISINTSNNINKEDDDSSDNNNEEFKVDLVNIINLSYLSIDHFTLLGNLIASKDFIGKDRNVPKLLELLSNLSKITLFSIDFLHSSIKDKEDIVERIEKILCIYDKILSMVINIFSSFEINVNNSDYNQQLYSTVLEIFFSLNTMYTDISKNNGNLVVPISSMCKLTVETLWNSSTALSFFFSLLRQPSTPLRLPEFSILLLMSENEFFEQLVFSLLQTKTETCFKENFSCLQLMAPPKQRLGLCLEKVIPFYSDSLANEKYLEKLFRFCLFLLETAGAEYLEALGKEIKSGRAGTVLTEKSTFRFLSEKEDRDAVNDFLEFEFKGMIQDTVSNIFKSVSSRSKVFMFLELFKFFIEYMKKTKESGDKECMDVLFALLKEMAADVKIEEIDLGHLKSCVTKVVQNIYFLDFKEISSFMAFIVIDLQPVGIQTVWLKEICSMPLTKLLINQTILYRKKAIVAYLSLFKLSSLINDNEDVNAHKRLIDTDSLYLTISTLDRQDNETSRLLRPYISILSKQLCSRDTFHKKTFVEKALFELLHLVNTDKDAFPISLTRLFSPVNQRNDIFSLLVFIIDNTGSINETNLNNMVKHSEQNGHSILSSLCERVEAFDYSKLTVVKGEHTLLLCNLLKGLIFYKSVCVSSLKRLVAIHCKLGGFPVFFAQAKAESNLKISKSRKTSNESQSDNNKTNEIESEVCANAFTAIEKLGDSLFLLFQDPDLFNGRATLEAVCGLLNITNYNILLLINNLSENSKERPVCIPGDKTVANIILKLFVSFSVHGVRMCAFIPRKDNVSARTPFLKVFSSVIRAFFYLKRKESFNVFTCMNLFKNVKNSEGVDRERESLYEDAVVEKITSIYKETVKVFMLYLERKDWVEAIEALRLSEEIYSFLYCNLTLTNLNIKNKQNNVNELKDTDNYRASVSFNSLFILSPTSNNDISADAFTYENFIAMELRNLRETNIKRIFQEYPLPNIPFLKELMVSIFSPLDLSSLLLSPLIRQICENLRRNLSPIQPLDILFESNPEDLYEKESLTHLTERKVFVHEPWKAQFSFVQLPGVGKENAASLLVLVLELFSREIDRVNGLIRKKEFNKEMFTSFFWDDLFVFCSAFLVKFLTMDVDGTVMFALLAVTTKLFKSVTSYLKAHVVILARANKKKEADIDKFNLLVSSTAVKILKKLARCMYKEVTEKAYSFIKEAQNQSNENIGVELKNKIEEEARRFPELIYSVEELARVCVSFLKNLGEDTSKMKDRSLARDFKIDLDFVKKRIEDDENDSVMEKKKKDVVE